MEAIAGLSLAANILQVVDFSASLLSSANQIRKNGSTARNSELNSVTVDLRNLNEDMMRSCGPGDGVAGPFSKEDLDLHNLAAQSFKSAEELIMLLSNLQISKRSGKFESVSAAIKTMWSKDKIDDANERLKTIRSQVMVRVIVSIKSKIDVLALKEDRIFLSFDDAKKEIIAAMLDDRQSVEALISDQTAAILRRHDHTDALIRQTIQRQHKQEILTPKQVTAEIITHLAFDAMEIRHEDIADNHLATFEWIFGEQKPSHSLVANKAGADFESWLRDEEGVYWISGKAGSGKSTLMKLIADHPRTSLIAEAWAKGQPLLFAPFYFWNAGTALQRTQNGLYRSIVVKTLKMFPDLAPSLFPYQFSTQASWEQFPTAYQLKHAFHSLIVQESRSFKILLLIDGLDEYEGNEADMFELAEMFKAATSSSVKAILSSRPLQAFEDAFASCPKLRLHDLTFQDISAYTDGKLNQHPRMQELTREDPGGTKVLVNEVVDSASGVFLWVTLVVRSLLVGLRNFDDISDLASRLSEMPRDLEALFQHMLSKIEPRYLAQSSQFFQIFRCSQELLDTSLCWASAELILTGVTLAWAGSETEAALNAEIKPVDHDDKVCLITQTDARLKSRCAGLLELRSSASFEHDASTSSTESRNWTDQMGQEDTWTGPEVRLLHKSVADFLYKPEVWSRVLSHTRKTTFDPRVALLGSILLWFKAHPSIDHDSFALSRSRPLNFAGSMAKLAELSSHQAHGSILEELDRVVAIDFQGGSASGAHWSDIMYRDESFKPPGSLLLFAIYHNLVLYVQEKLGKLEGGASSVKGMCLLHPACALQESMSRDMVRLLLRFGVDPNECHMSQNSLQLLVFWWCRNKYYQRIPSWERSELEEAVAIARLLLDYGADPNSIVEFDCWNRSEELERRRCSLLYLFHPGLLSEMEEGLIGNYGWDIPDTSELLRLIEDKGGKATAWVGKWREGADPEIDECYFTQVYPVKPKGSEKPEKTKRAYVKKLLANTFRRKA